MILGIKPDYFYIEKEGEKVYVPNVVIGISKNNLTKNGLYNALVGLDILEGGKTCNEFVRIVKE